jgi:DNA-binding transcriptional ArsR family regulator
MDPDLIHKALANPFRRDILTWLKAPHRSFARECSVFAHGVPASAIQARSGFSQSTVSAHLSVLIEAGLLLSKRAGQFTLLSRNEAVIEAFVAQMRSGL